MVVRKKSSKIDETDFLGNTALHYASPQGQELVVEELMSWGANPRKQIMTEKYQRRLLKII